jgi:recombination protein RecA
MRKQFLDILSKFKEHGIPVSKIEKDLFFANGLLGKIRKDENRNISQENFDKLYAYALLNKVIPPVIEKTKMVVEKEGIKEKPVSAIVDDTNEIINKRFGPGTIMRWGDKPDTDLKVISTGSLLLDKALGIGGLPRGRMVEIFGLESSGKSTITLHVIANAQKQGLRCLLIDAENSFDPEYAEALGVVIDDLEYCQPSYGEEGFEVADVKITTGKVGVVVIDSVAAMIPKGELEGAMGDSKLGLHARLMSQVCRKLVGSVAKTNTLCIFINQIRNKIGVTYGSPEVTTGGLALQFYSSIRLSVTRSITQENSVMNGGAKEGNQTTVKVIKNKCAPPFRQARFNIIYGKGVDRLGEIVDLAIEMGIIKQAGSWFSHNGNKLGQGKESVTILLKDNPELLQEIESQLSKKD